MEPNKKYHLFCFEDYYPGGGLNDYVGSYDSYQAALEGRNQVVDSSYMREDGVTWVERHTTPYANQNYQIVIQNEFGVLKEIQ